MTVDQTKVAFFQEQIRRFPTKEVPPYGLAKLYFDAGHYAEAEEPLRKAIAIKPDFSIAMWYLARCLVQLGRTDEARSMCEKGIDSATRMHESSPAEGMQQLLDEMDAGTAGKKAP